MSVIAPPSAPVFLSLISQPFPTDTSIARSALKLEQHQRDCLFAACIPFIHLPYLCLKEQ